MDAGEDAVGERLFASRLAWRARPIALSEGICWSISMMLSRRVVFKLGRLEFFVVPGGVEDGARLGLTDLR
jgi:hypothetical protein